MQVQSEEPWIPWELCKLVSAPAGGGVEEGPFLCRGLSAHAMDSGLPQFPQVRMNRLALVVPDDSGLAFAAAERDYMLSLASPARQVTRIPATFLDVQAALGVGRIRHLAFQRSRCFRNEAMPDRSGMILQGGDRLTPENLSGRTANLGKVPPLGFPECLPDRPVGHVAHGHGRLGHSLFESRRRGLSGAALLVGLRRAGPELRQILLRPARWPVTPSARRPTRHVWPAEPPATHLAGVHRVRRSAGNPCSVTDSARSSPDDTMNDHIDSS